MTNAITSDASIMKELPKIIAWMEALGLSAGNSRYSRYEKIINKFYAKELDPSSDEGKQCFTELTQAYRECTDIYLVYKCFAHVTHPNFLAKMKKVIKGQEVPNLKDAGTSRDFLFELLVAARFQLAGYTIDFDETTDVVAIRGVLVVRVECKRIGSEARLGERIAEAANQLTKPMVKARLNVINIIYVDISSCVLADVSQLVETAKDAKCEMQAVTVRFLQRNARLVETLNEKYIDISHGTCLIATLPIWSRDFVMHTTAATQVRAAEKLSDEKYGMLQNALADFDDTFTKLFG